MSAFQISTRVTIVAIVAAACLLLPLLIHAQTTSASDLSTTVRAALLKDPRAAALPPSELDAMVNALTAKAQAQGMTAQDIAYRPGTIVPSVPVSSGTCTDISSPLCALGQALGFDSPDKRVPIGLWITSVLLIVVIWHMRKNPHLTGIHPTQQLPSSGNTA